MASIVLGAAGKAIGMAVGGPIGAAIGSAIGTAIGTAVDSWIVAGLTPAQHIEGQKLQNLQVTTSTEGGVVPRVFGRMRLGGNIIWATDFTEHTSTTSQGGKGGGPKVTTTTYSYTASFALALCEGEISGIGRVWADGKPLDMTGLTTRLYVGSETQLPDSYIEAKMGVGASPAYRGVAYLMFEELDLTQFGNRIPQFSVEVIAPVVAADTVEGMLEAVTMIPATGEFQYSTTPVSQTTSGVSTSENVHSSAGVADIVAALDQLQAAAPNIKSVSLVVAWFGDDLRAGNCKIMPGVESATKQTTPISWAVDGVARVGAHQISADANGKLAFGGTPSDASIVEAIQEINGRGLAVTFYPFLLMDIPVNNALPDPYSANEATVGQGAYPWRGRITCSPAAGYVGTVDKTAAAGGQITAFFGGATPANYSVSGTVVSWTGGADWGYRRMILHYAHLCAAAGGVDSFLIGSELRGITSVRNSATTYPAPAALAVLAADVSGILAGAKIGYAADWSEYFGHHPADGSGDVFFNMDALWADANIDFVGIDNYFPLSDWRDGTTHADAALWSGVHDLGYLQSNIEGGEGYDWYYATSADRTAQVRTPITDGAYAKTWVFRPKDVRNWWLNAHYDRLGGVESATATGWVPQSKPIRFTELGCPAVDRGTNQPNVFYDPKSAESAVPYFSRGWSDEAIQRRYIEATLGHWLANNPTSAVYAGPMIDMPRAAVWTWDARPFPDFPARADVWSDAPNWRLGHWLNGRIGVVGLASLVRELCVRAGIDTALIDTTELYESVNGYIITALESPRASISALARHFGFDAIESGGQIKFVTRGQAPALTISPDGMVEGQSGEPMELLRGQETELPQALKWEVVRADEEYGTAVVEARRVTVQSTRVGHDGFHMAVPLEAADRRCRRALLEGWVGREGLTCKLPKSALSLDPGDVIALSHDGRLVDYRITKIGDSDGRHIEAMRADAKLYDLPPGKYRQAKLLAPTVYGGPDAVVMDLPQMSDAVDPSQPYAAVFSSPWYGTAAVWRSATTSGFTLLDSVYQPAHMGTLAGILPPGAEGRFDNGAEVLVDLTSGTLTSVTDIELFGGKNTLAVETVAGVWEIVQFGTVELLGTGTYRLTHLLRGQRGTETALSAPVGARVVILDSAIQPLSMTLNDIQAPYNLRIGPASAAPSDANMAAISYTDSGRGLRPFSPAQARMRRVGADLQLRWVRRDRAIAADSWVLTEVPMSEASESYELEIMSGAVVKRSLTAASPAFTYTAAMQAADFGGAVTSLAVKIYQIGAFGRGDALSGTLTITEAT